MSDPVPSSAIYDATTGGRSIIVVSGVATDAVDMTQAAIVADASSADPFENAATTESTPEVSTEPETSKPTSKKKK